MQKLVLIRHGESIWNHENRFTGWTDVDLDATGYEQAKRAGQILKQNGFVFDVGYTSVLKRSIKTLHILLEELDQLWIPIDKSWRLNERFYGALQGLNKQDAIDRYGEDQVHRWRRDPNEDPPPIAKTDARYPGHDLKYKSLTEDQLPVTENLSQTMDRVLPLWNDKIIPALKNQQKIIICGHGNSLRALIKYIDNLNDNDVTQLEIPEAIPLIYELDEQLNRTNHYYFHE